VGVLSMPKEEHPSSIKKKCCTDPCGVRGVVVFAIARNERQCRVII